MEVLEIQKKNCGHFCYPSITIDCCTCMDTRPILPENNYPMYIDGVGWSNTASRNAGYCHIWCVSLLLLNLNYYFYFLFLIII